MRPLASLPSTDDGPDVAASSPSDPESGEAAPHRADGQPSGIAPCPAPSSAVPPDRVTGTGGAARGAASGVGRRTDSVAYRVGSHPVLGTLAVVVAVLVLPGDLGVWLPLAGALGVAWSVGYRRGRDAHRTRVDGRRSSGTAGRAVSADPARIGARHRVSGSVRRDQRRSVAR